MAFNTVTHAGETHTRKGRRYSHVVISTSTDNVRPDGTLRPLVEWASTLELAQRNQSAIMTRAETVKAGRELRGMWSIKYYANFVDAVLLTVEHPEEI